MTEQANDNPKFAADLMRDVTLDLLSTIRTPRVRVETENQESIRPHSACAVANWPGVR